MSAITLPIEPYYHNAYVYYRDAIYPSDEIFFNYSTFHKWLTSEYNLEIIVPRAATDYILFSSIEDQILFAMTWS